MNPLRGGFPDGGGLKINRRARSLSVCELEAWAGAVDEAGAGGLETFDAVESPDGFPAVLWVSAGRMEVDSPAWLVG
jgi:hypothetical protein